MRCAAGKRYEGGGATGRIAPRRRVVLVVDDDADVREALALALELAGYLTVRAGDGLDALLALRTGPPPDAIVLDLEMPIMSGWDFRAAQLRDPDLARIPVVVLSSSPREVSADRRLPKPSALDDVLRAVAEVAGAP
jgi:CheY-like chemotaxis protein